VGIPRLLVVLGAGVAVAVVAACGGSGEDPQDGSAAVVETVESTSTLGPAPEGSIRALLNDGAGEDVALIFGTSDFAVGENRLSFLVVNARGELVEAPGARVRIARGDLDAVPELDTAAGNLPVGAPPETREDGDFDAPTVYVLNVELDAPGLYSLLVEPEGKPVQAYGQIEVAEESSALPVGAKAPLSDTPTLDDGFPEDITTATPPDVELLQYSIKESIEAAVPFVVTFATPKFCVSRVCGPVVDIVDAVRERLAGTGVRFIHVEIYEANDPERGFNRWVREWNLPTEPYTFLVDGSGVIRARFEGLVAAGELEQAVRDSLLQGS
jgi:hypothetical protein